MKLKVPLCLFLLTIIGCTNPEMKKPLDKFDVIKCKDYCLTSVWMNDDMKLSCLRYCDARNSLREQ